MKIKLFFSFILLMILAWNAQVIWVAYENNKKLETYTEVLALSLKKIRKAKTTREISSALILYQWVYDNPPEIWSMNQLNKNGEENGHWRLLRTRLAPEVVKNKMIKELELPSPDRLRQKIEKNLRGKRLKNVTLTV